MRFDIAPDAMSVSGYSSMPQEQPPALHSAVLKTFFLAKRGIESRAGLLTQPPCFKQVISALIGLTRMAGVRLQAAPFSRNHISGQLSAEHHRSTKYLQPNILTALLNKIDGEFRSRFV
jgi:hypothetical protein